MSGAPNKNIVRPLPDDGALRPASFPDFFIIGAPKCGTTTLYAMLSGHAAVALPRKEPSWLSQDVEDTSYSALHIATQADYEAIYTGLAAGVRAGDATPRTLYSHAALDLIVAHRPDAKLIGVVRDPVDLAFSYHGQKLREGEERERNFETAWRRGVDGATGRPLTDTPRFADGPHKGAINYAFWARYGAHLARWRAVFGADQLLLLTLDDLQDLSAAYGTVLAHLGVPDDGRRVFAIANRRVEVRNMALHQAAVRAVRTFEPVMAPLRRAFGGPFGITKALNAINIRPEGDGASGVSADFRAFMMAGIDDDLATAEAVLGRVIAKPTL
ncbi:MAG: sulfotransferase [Pseudomonadota bacterium]